MDNFYLVDTTSMGTVKCMIPKLSEASLLVDNDKRMIN